MLLSQRNVHITKPDITYTCKYAFTLQCTVFYGVCDTFVCRWERWIHCMSATNSLSGLWQLYYTKQLNPLVSSTAWMSFWILDRSSGYSAMFDNVCMRCWLSCDLIQWFHQSYTLPGGQTEVTSFTRPFVAFVLGGTGLRDYLIWGQPPWILTKTYRQGKELSQQVSHN